MSHPSLEQEQDISATARRRPSAWPWRTALREFVVILAGVLGALAAQAWWQHRQDAERERDYLRQLVGDTRENVRRLDDAIAADSGTAQAIARLTSTLYGNVPAPSPDSLAAWFGNPTFSASDFQPLTGSYTALVSSGDLRIIHNDSLRSQLVAYAARLESERENLLFFFEQAFSDPGRIARVLPFMRGVLVERTHQLRPERLGTATIARMRADPELASIMFSVQAANLNRLAHLRGMRSHTRELLATLEAEPGATPSSGAMDAGVGGRQIPATPDARKK